jgi:hypothetical protein
MKCPKCGSEVNYRDEMLGVRNCKKCGCFMDLYQQRLDNVLSKFSKHNNDLYWSKEFIVYDVGKKTFHISNYELNDLSISLETVESLLKDIN